jgi:hypothetical protein
MEQYIPKFVLVAELNKRLQERKSIKPSKEDDFGQGYLVGRDTEDKAILYFIDTQDVKEVNLDFEQELYKAFGRVNDFTLGMRIAKYFFELGIAVSNEAHKGE